MNNSSKIMFIDDDIDQLEMIECMLLDRGYDVKCFSCPKEALSCLKHESFSVIITDMQMGEMSGIDLCRIVSKEYNDIPVIILTGYGCFSTAMSAIDAGAKDFLTKPFEALDLHTVIEKVLS